MKTLLKTLLFAFLPYCSCTDSKDHHNYNPPENLDDTSPAGDFSQIINDQKNTDKQTIYIDTQFIISKIPFNIKIKSEYTHKINIPKKYVNIYKIEYYKANDYKYIIELKYRDKSNTISIDKSKFPSFTNIDLKKYGQLVYRKISLSNNKVNIKYSISIPLTDIGKPEEIAIDTIGNYTVVKAE
ncbi:hypothetical protein [Hymenobacter algoricola]|uniref:DUF4738 domain-containing protein n=1 Tax=Hymenobacter algoricola TaxID=486267 RepID=A0ABP7N572_9BACT